ncbi:dihydrolipoamide acetyltransferase family protein [Cohaesibacter celericrescens]|uniref:Dihydrolipoamide acetyltransferase component of pyruvate dehydrogenase complex n=1 Tax=Cohaesibacter celericrescens TaxID=2067669 RepID=A0A2N5XVL6_9HYPH|nr:dihydrolipoamide acetyltransferase family protein [Cohaesibacter celericrescens]PLW78475.1 2-oxo acid dehydrogenase subunit E2 [Cohaesibacter celericrescens]
MIDFLMPSLGADMEDGKLVEWLVEPGAMLKHGDTIAVVETQKGAIEIEIFNEGIFDHPLVDIGMAVPVGTPIAAIRERGEAAAIRDAEQSEKSEPITKAADGSEAVADHKPAAEAEPVAGPTGLLAEARVTTPAGERTRVSPIARRYADQHGIDVASISGSGPSGEVLLQDVEMAEKPAERTILSTKEPAPIDETETGERLSGMRAAIATAMSRSKREIPHFYLAHSIDLTLCEAWLADYNAERAPESRLLLSALLVKAVALAAHKYPEFNGHYIDGVFHSGAAIHVGVAINIRGTGLVAPAIHNAEGLSLEGLMVKMRDLVVRVRAGRFRSSELSDPTITVSIMGDRGVETLYGVIYPPQVAIIGFGMPVTEARVVDGMIGPRRIVHVTLASDHRINDGHRGALLLARIERILQEPEKL